MQNDRKFYHSERENLMSSSPQDPIRTGKPVALLSSKNRLNQETFSNREDFLEDINRFFWEQRTFLQIFQPGKCCEISS